MFCCYSVLFWVCSIRNTLLSAQRLSLSKWNSKKNTQCHDQPVQKHNLRVVTNWFEYTDWEWKWKSVVCKRWDKGRERERRSKMLNVYFRCKLRMGWSKTFLLICLRSANIIYLHFVHRANCLGEGININFNDDWIDEFYYLIKSNAPSDLSTKASAAVNPLPEWYDETLHSKHVRMSVKTTI